MNSVLTLLLLLAVCVSASRTRDDTMIELKFDLGDILEFLDEFDPATAAFPDGDVARLFLPKMSESPIDPLSPRAPSPQLSGGRSGSDWVKFRLETSEDLESPKIPDSPIAKSPKVPILPPKSQSPNASSPKVPDSSSPKLPEAPDSTTTKSPKITTDSPLATPSSKSPKIPRDLAPTNSSKLPVSPTAKLPNISHPSIPPFHNFSCPKGKFLPNLPRLMKDEGLHIFTMLLKKVGLLSGLADVGPFTVFGPTDEAFLDLPPWEEKKMENPKTLTYYLAMHILDHDTCVKMEDIKNEMLVRFVPGGHPLRLNVYPNATTYQCSPIVREKADQKAKNGVLHQLSRVVTPPMGTIMEVLTQFPHFSALVKLINGTAFEETFQYEGPLTLFAPTDDAFDDLSSTFLNFVVKNETARIELLKYHITNGTYCMAGLGSFSNFTMLDGHKTGVKKSPFGAYGHIWINDAAILVPGEDTSVTNGVMHSLNKVLIPPGLQPFPHDSD